MGVAILPSLVPAGGDDARTHRYVASGAENAVSATFLVGDVLEVVFLSRLFLKALLETRNDVLARSVRDACADERDCERAGKRENGKKPGRWWPSSGAAHLPTACRRDCCRAAPTTRSRRGKNRADVYVVYYARHSLPSIHARRIFRIIHSHVVWVVSLIEEDPR